MNEVEDYFNTRPSSSTFSRPNWSDDGKWKKRYSKLYTTRRKSLLGHDIARAEDHTRISFLSNDTSPYTNLLRRVRMSREKSSSENLPIDTLEPLTRDNQSEAQSSNELALLNILQAKSRSQDTQNTHTNVILPVQEESDDNTEDQDSCLRSLVNLRMHTERSMSRSRMSRISTKRDMDIPSILAFNVNEGTSFKSQAHTELPALPPASAPASQPIPRWSIRRALCPVCSQKWRDNTSITKIRNSGFKRKSTLDLLSVVAPARLRTSITLEYSPHPTPVASDKEAGVIRGGLRNTSASWQLTRARRFRIPKTNLPPEATAPPTFIEPMARKDLDNRVQKFLKT